MTLRQAILTETYADLHKMVYMLTRRMAFRYSIPMEDLIGVSHEIFVKACDAVLRSENPQHRKQITSWVYAKIQWGLLSYMRKEYRHLNLRPIEDAPQRSCAPNNFLVELQSELSAEASQIVELILDARSDFALLCCWRKTRTKTAIIDVLTEHLEDEGWSRERILKRFAEIRSILNGTRPDVPINSFWSTE